ncbi:hypothetical protein V6N13_114902 [Hibiscus sabdariffa]
MEFKIGEMQLWLAYKLSQLTFSWTREFEIGEIGLQAISSNEVSHLRPKEARKVLKLGKRLGVEIIGDEQEVVKEIARLELGEAD